MDNLVALLSAWAWPLTVLVIVWVFHKQLRSAIDRIREIGKGVAKFDRPPQTQVGLTEETPGLGNIRRDVSSGAPLSMVQGGTADLKSSTAPAYHPFIDEVATRLQGGLPTDSEKRMQTLLNVAIDSIGALHLERVYAIIYGSQIRSIEHIIACGGRASTVSLRPFYDAAKQQYSELYQNYPFERWLGFMLAPFGPVGSLVKIAGDDVELAPAGQALIPYLRTRGYTLARYG